jgi:uncharacterized BrkB/YihY/UPF0761 family membrane protein
MENQAYQEKENIAVLPTASVTAKQKPKLSSAYIIGISTLVILFIGIMFIIAYLPMTRDIKIISLLLGGFLVFDIHHTLKYYVDRIN